jgi:2-hydroxychromene-2-carboxylate isomerase
VAHDIEFFFDIASPYSYLAATQMDDIAERTGAHVEWKPFLLGGVFKAVGNTTPAALQQKAAWAMRDLQLWADRYDEPFTMASRFPINSLMTQRALVAARQNDPGSVSALALALYRAYWVDDADVSAPQVIRDVAEQAGFDGAEIIELTASSDVKGELRELTEVAISRGAFGAPTFFVDGRLFWGNDRLHFVEMAAVGEI